MKYNNSNEYKLFKSILDDNYPPKHIIYNRIYNIYMWNKEIDELNNKNDAYFTSIYSNNINTKKNFKMLVKYSYHSNKNNKFTFEITYDKFEWGKIFGTSTSLNLNTYIINTPCEFNCATKILKKEGVDDIDYIIPFGKLLECDTYNQYVDIMINNNIDNKYIIVDYNGDAGPKGGEIPIDEDMSDSELYWNEIINDRKPVDSNEQPILIIMYGPIGSGKSKVLKTLYKLLGYSEKDFVNLNPDHCREFSKEYRKCISGINAVKLNNVIKEYGDRIKATKWKSSDGMFEEDGFTVDGKYLALANSTLRSQFLVRKKMLWGKDVKELSDAYVDQAFKHGYNVVYDTMGNEPNRFLRELMRRARLSRKSCVDYKVIVCGCYTKWDLCKERFEKRAIDTGRYVDETFAKKEYDAMYPLSEDDLPINGVDKTHHNRFAVADNDKYKPMPFETGELKPGDIKCLFNNNNTTPQLSIWDIVD